VAPAAKEPVYVPLNVCTVAPEAFFRTAVIGWAPPAEAMLPWFFRLAVKVTVLPALGLLGDQEVVAIKSELCTWPTTRGDEAVKLLFELSVSTTALFSSTLAETEYEPASLGPMFAVTVVDAPGARPATEAVPARAVPR